MLDKAQAIQKMNEKVAEFKSNISPDAVTKVGTRKGTPFHQIVDEYYAQTAETLFDRFDNVLIYNEFVNTLSGMQRRAR